MMLIAAASAQQIACPIDYKRNNGNPDGTGGKITLIFGAVPNPQLQVELITGSGSGGIGSATIIASTKEVANGSGGKGLTWNFETNNLPPVNQTDAYTVQLYIDANGNNKRDTGDDPLTPQVEQLEPIYYCSNNASLPVTLANFNAVQRSNKVNLTWETLSELNNDGFEIERRIGNGTYQKIAFIDSKAPGGNGDAYSYSFEDVTNLPKGVTYYRLRQVDLDGRATYSEIKAVRTGNGTIILSVYPNPSRGTVNVAIPSGVGTYDISVDDFTGKSVQRFSGLTTSNLQLNNLKPGMYMLRVSIRSTNETITERIAVQ